MSILSRMASGDVPVAEGYVSVGDIDNPTIDAVVNESRVPLGTIIESVCTDTNAGILLAYETFELQCCIGAASVVSEGADANIVLENAITAFFGKIVEKLKQFGAWIKSIFDKIFKRKKDQDKYVRLITAIDVVTGKVKTKDGKTFGDKLKEVKETNPTILGDSFYIIDAAKGNNGALKAIEVCQKNVNLIVNNVEKLNKQFSDVSAQFTDKQDVPDFDTDDKEDAATSKRLYGDIAKALNVSSIGSTDDIKKALNSLYGKGDNDKPAKISQLTTESIGTTVMNLTSKTGIYAEVEKISKETLGSIDKTIADLKKMEQEAAKYAKKDVNKYAGKASKMVSKLISVQTIITAIINHTQSVVESATKSYCSMIERVFGGTNSPANESMDFTMYLESKDVDDEGIPDDSDDDAAPATESVDYGTPTDALGSYIQSYV